MSVLSAFNVAAVLIVVAIFVTEPLLCAEDSAKKIEPKCSTQIDPNDDNLILMVCDFSGLSVAEKVVKAKAYVEISDGSGKVLGSQTLQFADEQHALRGGKKYSRRFECSVTKKPSSGVKTVKISSAEAEVMPVVSAVHQ